MAHLSNSPAGYEDDDFEYHLTFPSPTPRNVINGEADDFVYVEKEEKEPVVLLLGWAGCRDQNLSKYSELYQLKGCITIRYVPSAKDLFYHPSKFQHIALKLLEMLSDLNLEDHPIFFHMFSNGGCIIYHYISEFVCKEPSNQVRVSGCMFDSGPTVNTIVGTTRATLASVKGGILYRLLMGAMTFFYFAFVGLIDYISSLIWKQKHRCSLNNLWKTLAEESMRCPQLFLYSKADITCNYKNVQRFLEHRRSKGILVHAVCWEDSPHVDHLNFHTEAYAETIYNFLDVCLKNEAQTSRYER